MRGLASFERALHRTRRNARDVESLREFSAYLAGCFLAHLSEEERVLFPALARVLPELTPALDVFRDDHAELRQLSRDLRALLD